MALDGGTASQLFSNIVTVSRGAFAGTVCSTAPTGPMSTPVLGPEWHPAQSRRDWLSGTSNPSHERQIEEHEGRKEPSKLSSVIHTLLSLNKTCLSSFQNVQPLLECLQVQRAHYHDRWLLTKVRGICFHHSRLPLGPHGGNLLQDRLADPDLTAP